MTAVGGAGTMIVELAAVRLLAPWFGTSLVVWTNVIAVVLLALALGYLAGGRLAGGEKPLERLGWILVVAGPIVAWAPAVSAPLARFVLPAELGLDEAAGLVLWGSLAVSLVLFLPPATLLGAVSPLAVEAVARLDERSAGSAGGRVLAASTLGSLIGVFGTSHTLLPTLGLTGTFLLASVFLVIAGVSALKLSRSLRLLPLVAAALPWSAAVGWGITDGGPFAAALGPDPPAGWKLLARAESPYQSIRVVEEPASADFGPMRYLQVNEAFDSFQSVWQPAPGLLPTGFYYNGFALPPHWSRAQGPWSVLVLGLGAGTAVRVLEGAAPDGCRPEYVGVELDPRVVELATRHMGLPPDDDRHAFYAGLDARVATRALGRSFDQIVLDCYANQVEIPAHLCTVEFFQELRTRLVAGGWLCVNLGGFGFDDPLVRAVARTAARGFEAPVLLVAVPRSRNFVLFARHQGELPLSDGGTEPVAGAVGSLLAPLALPGFVQIVEADAEGLVLRDDLAPVELLQQLSIAEGQRRRRGGGDSG